VQRFSGHLGIAQTGEEVMRVRTLILAWLLLGSTPAGAAGLRYERDGNLIVVDGVWTTPSAIKAALPHAPLTLVDRERRVWLLSANLLLTNGGALRLYGRRAGGDVDELRLRSDNPPGPAGVISLTADHGVLDIRSTRVWSWDTAADGPDLEYESYGRAFIRARSRLRSNVLTRLESRLDVTDSEIAYLGYDANESYGLVWKVVAPDAYVFNHVRVYGNVVRSRIHHNYFGLYAAGARGNEWIGNDVHHNVQYGLAPHTRSDDLLIDANDVHDNGNHGITVRQHCARVRIRNNRVWGNRAGGLTLHRGSDGGFVTGNQVFRNAGSGITIYDSAGVTVRANTVADNGQSGIQLAMDAARNRVEDNEISGNRFYGLFLGKGRGRPVGGRDGMPRQNQISGNRVRGSGIADLRTGDPTLNAWNGNEALPVAATAGATVMPRATATPPP
jgi:mannuronan 5-epimerase